MNDAGRLVAVVPMKPALEGKTRLSKVLDSGDRAALCLLLLQHVLGAIRQSACSPEIWVIGGDASVRKIAAEESAIWHDARGIGLNEAIRYAADKAFQEGAAGVLVLPGDLGILKPEDVDELVRLSSGLKRFVLASAESDGGTNALLVPRGMLMGPFFGPSSFRRHRDTTLEAGFPVEVAEFPGLGFDLDTPEDLEYYRNVTPDLDVTLSCMKGELAKLALSGLHGIRSGSQ